MSSDSSAEPFGRYLLHQRIAEGGMAEVFLAEQPSTAGVTRFLAIKRMLPHMCLQQQFVDMFLDEARLTARMNHQNIAQIYDFGEVNGRYFIAMEYVVGETLLTVAMRALEQGKTIPLHIGTLIVSQVCEGLAHAHALRADGQSLHVVHRDISPSNIVITFQGAVKLLDFGIAHTTDRQQEPTVSGVVKGKLAYCSPEQLMGIELDGRSDIFSLAVVLFEILSGKRLFKRSSDVNTSWAVMNDPVPSLRTLRPDAPEGLDRVLARALEKDREKRYPNATEFRRDLDALNLSNPQRLDEWLATVFGERTIQNALDFAGLKKQVTPELLDSVRPKPSRPGLAGERRNSRSDLPAMPTQPPSPVPPPPPAAAQGDRHTQVLPITVEEPGTPLPSATLDAQKPKQSQGVVKLAVGAVVLLSLVGAGYALFGGKPTEVKPVVPPVEAVAPQKSPRAKLRIETLPAGATLTVGGRPVPEKSPAVVGDLVPGDVVVVATLDGHEPLTQVVQLQADTERSVVLTLKALVGRLSIEAPAGASVSVDGKAAVAGLSEWPVGLHQVRVELAGKVLAERGVEVKAGQTETVQALVATAPVKPKTPAEKGFLDVACTPWCRIEIDGVDIEQQSPLIHWPVSVGNRKVVLEYPPTGRNQKQTVTIKVGETSKVVGTFK